MTYCKRCVLPNTRPGLVLAEDGVCNACLYAWRKQHEINWHERAQEFRTLVAQVKEKRRPYDCVIPVSGGKDSFWQVLTCLEWGLRPLAVTWKPSVRTPIGVRNLGALINLGIDHIDFRVNPHVERRFMLRSFIDKGTPAVPMHLAMFNISLNVALAHNVPLMVWGENSSEEYGAASEQFAGKTMDESWLKTFNTRGTSAADWVSETLTRAELEPYFGPSAEAVAKSGLVAVFLGHYFPWDPQYSRQVAEARGFTKNAGNPLTGFYDFADLDDTTVAVHHWLKWYKFGLTRTFDNLSLEIRHGRMTRDEAIEIIKDRRDEVPREAIQQFCDYVGITVEGFYAIAEMYRNQGIWKRIDGEWQLPGFLIKDWSWHENNRETASQKI